VEHLHGIRTVPVGFWMDDVCAPSVGYDRHTIVLAVNHFLGHISVFCWHSMPTKRSVARHKRRKNCNMPSLFFGSMASMVLVGSILIPKATFQGPAHPFSTLTRQLEGAYTCIQRLDEAVDLSPSTFMKYQSLEAKKWWKEIKTEEKKNEVN
jgi:hypothetical protein